MLFLMQKLTFLSIFSLLTSVPETLVNKTILKIYLLRRDEHFRGR